LVALILQNNSIADLSPLLANSGLGTDDSVMLIGNRIDCSGEAADIQALLDRGVVLNTDCD
jgi:hypothetical protein